VFSASAKRSVVDYMLISTTLYHLARLYGQYGL
jgi:hypothetical protein